MRLAEHVYIMRSPIGLKVGMAISPVDRANQLRIETGHPHELVEAYRTPSWALWSEREVHEQLAEYRLSGEYFDAPLGVVRQAILDCGCELDEVPPQSQKQKSIRFSADELALLDRLAEKHGTIKGAVMAGLYALDEGANAAVSAAVAAELEKMAKQIREGLK